MNLYLVDAGIHEVEVPGLIGRGKIRIAEAVIADSECEARSEFTAHVKAQDGLEVTDDVQVTLVECDTAFPPGICPDWDSLPTAFFKVLMG